MARTAGEGQSGRASLIHGRRSIEHTHAWHLLTYYLLHADQRSTNVEAIASLAADEFYSDQPELALVLFR
jgi:hypothetical protein